MDPFVKECRKEWKRLGVADADANEMAAELEADLNEAESEGVTREEVLGTGVFDPRAFAASWAIERGVVPPSPQPHREPRRSPMLVAVVAFAILAAVGGGLLLGTRGGSVVSVPLAGPPFREILPGAPPAYLRPPLLGGPQTRCTIHSPMPGQVPAPRCLRQWTFPGPIARFVLGPTSRASQHVGWVLFIVGLAGILVLALMWWVVPGPWSRRRSASP